MMDLIVKINKENGNKWFATSNMQAHLTLFHEKALGKWRNCCKTFQVLVKIESICKKYIIVITRNLMYL